VACICEMKRSRGGVSLWDEAWNGGAVEARGVGWPLEKMSCLVPLRTGMLREPDHRTLRTHHSSLVKRGTDVDLLGGATTARLIADSVGRYGRMAHTLLKTTW
jgi:hypothetical protein